MDNILKKLYFLQCIDKTPYATKFFLLKNQLKYSIKTLDPVKIILFL